MAKKTRPSFSAKPKARKPATDWVYRTDAPTPAGRVKPAQRATPAKRAKPVERVEPAEPAVLSVVHRYTAAAAVAAAVPLPLADLAAVAAVHVMMVRAIAAEYGVPFDRVLGRAAIAAVAGGAVSEWLGRGLGRSVLKAIPGVGTLAASAAMPASTAAATYVMGRIFIAHFESGGTLGDLDAGAAERHRRAIAGEAA